MKTSIALLFSVLASVSAKTFRGWRGTDHAYHMYFSLFISVFFENIFLPTRKLVKPTAKIMHNTFKIGFHETKLQSVFSAKNRTELVIHGLLGETHCEEVVHTHEFLCEFI